jgi:hypothetical protein
VEEEKTLLDVIIQLATWCFREAIDIMEEQEKSKRNKLSDKVFDKK